jgi:hypothetical protein
MGDGSGARTSNGFDTRAEIHLRGRFRSHPPRPARAPAGSRRSPIFFPQRGKSGASRDGGDLARGHLYGFATRDQVDLRGRFRSAGQSAGRPPSPAWGPACPPNVAGAPGGTNHSQGSLPPSPGQSPGRSRRSPIFFPQRGKSGASRDGGDPSRGHLYGFATRDQVDLRGRFRSAGQSAGRPPSPAWGPACPPNVAGAPGGTNHSQGSLPPSPGQSAGRSRRSPIFFPQRGKSGASRDGGDPSRGHLYGFATRDQVDLRGRFRSHPPRPARAPGGPLSVMLRRVGPGVGSAVPCPPREGCGCLGCCRPWAGWREEPERCGLIGEWLPLD